MGPKIFLTRSWVQAFKRIDPIDVISTSGFLQITVKGTVWILLDEGMVVEAIFTPNFLTKILDVSNLTCTFEMIFNKTDDDDDGKRK